MVYDEVLAGRLRDIAAGIPGSTERKMFGGLAFLVNGNLAVAASSEGGLLLRFPPARADDLLRRPHADASVMRGRSMTGWMRVETAGLTSDADVERWAEIGLSHAASLPPK